MEVQLIRRSHSVGKNTWHMEWCTKYRYKMMQKPENQNIIKTCIRQAAYRHDIKILAIKALPEHVHCIVELQHEMDDTKAVKLLKGYSSWKILRVKEKFRLRYPKGHFWSCGYIRLFV